MGVQEWKVTEVSLGKVKSAGAEQQLLNALGIYSLEM